MTLNSSGPISLGGPTTGQSINLELGQSAAQQVSLNDTNVRTLAGVASGPIAIPTNFYGKSSSVGWILFTGRNTSSFNNQQQGGGFVVDASSNIYWTYYKQTAPNAYGYAAANKDGTVTAYTAPYGSSTGPQMYPIVSKYSGTRVPFSTNNEINSSYPLNVLNSSLTKDWSSPRGYSSGGSGGATYAYAGRSQMGIASDGAVYVPVLVSQPKSINAFGLVRQTSTGSVAWFKNTSGMFGALSCTAAVLTDDTGVLYVKYGGASSANMFFFSTSGTITQYSSSNVYDTGGDPLLVVDSSNNIYFTHGDLRVFKLNANKTAGYVKSFSFGSAGYPANLKAQSLAEYNGNLYIASYDSTNANGKRGVYIHCFTASTFTHQWTNWFSFASASNYSAIGGVSIYANADGVFTSFICDQGTLGSYIMRIPLTGMPSNSSVVVNSGGVNRTLSWIQNITNPTITTDSNFPFTSDSRTFFNGGSSTGTTYTATSVAAPTATKTSV